MILLWSDIFQTFFPEVFKRYDDANMKFHLQDALLSQVFPDCPFFALSVNYGPQTVCEAHRDMMNLPSGLCPIMAFGRYDFCRGGHLRLHEAKVRLEVRPGDVVFIPSATITHSNTPIAPGETRYSVTLYSSGTLFQFIDNNFVPKMMLPAVSDKEAETFWQASWLLYPRISIDAL